MKKVFLSIAYILIAQMAMAQDANFKADVVKLISITNSGGAGETIKLVKTQFVSMLPEAKKEKFTKAFDASLPKMYDKLANIYMEIYTPEDIKAMIAFYESPVGKKMSEKAGELSQKIIPIGQEWGKELQELMAKYKDEELTENPYTVSKPK